MLTALILTAAAIQPPVRPPDAVVPEEEVIVTGRRASSTPRFEPIAYFRRHCFDAHRLGRGPLAPDGEPGWEPLDEEQRARARITDPATGAWALLDGAREHLLVLKLEAGLSSWRIPQSRCTLTILGGGGHGDLERQVSRMFGGPGTRRHVGHGDGVPEFEGWRQVLWTARPGRNSRLWRADEAAGAARAGGTWTVVTRPSFYDRVDYVLVDLRTRVGAGRPTSVLTFQHTTKDGRAGL